ncbi:MAG: URC4/urg3 family protein [Actinomycetota bacterium]
MTDLEVEAISYLRTPAAIRERCNHLFHLACEEQLRYFRIDLTRLDTVADYVLTVIHDQYPDFQIPFHSRWRHFEVGEVPRLAELNEAIADLAPLAQAKVKFDLAITSVLLDAGAGSAWQYYEPETGEVYRRSEGLAVASFRMFCQGFFSSDPDFPFQADAAGLQRLNPLILAAGFQVTEENPLAGLEGRVHLLQTLGKVLSEHPLLFGGGNLRPGNLARYFRDSRFSGINRIQAVEVFSAILTGFSEIWPGRSEIAGVNLGDVWVHPALPGDRPGEQLIPFHKLSQWLTYSLLEPLTELGLEVTDLEELTGLAEYRNGGLCLDLGLLVAKDPSIFQTPHSPDSEVIVEWRALTVSLLDRIAEVIRQKLNLTALELPLVKILQGGTWTAGRRIASELRPGGRPPLQIESDGTVF